MHFLGNNLQQQLLLLLPTDCRGSLGSEQESLPGVHLIGHASHLMDVHLMNVSLSWALSRMLLIYVYLAGVYLVGACISQAVHIRLLLVVQLSYISGYMH